MFFSWLDWDYEPGGESSQREMTFSSYLIKSVKYQYDSSLLILILVTWLGVVLVRFLSLPPLFHIGLSGRGSPGPAPHWGMELQSLSVRVELGFPFKNQPPVFLSSFLPSLTLTSVASQSLSFNVCLIFFLFGFRYSWVFVQSPHAPLFLKGGFPELALQMAPSLAHSGRKGSLDQHPSETLITYLFLETQSSHEHNKRSGNKEACLTESFPKPISPWNLFTIIHWFRDICFFSYILLFWNWDAPYRWWEKSMFLFLRDTCNNGVSYTDAIWDLRKYSIIVHL